MDVILFLRVFACLCALYFFIASWIVTALRKELKFKDTPLSTYAIKKGGNFITVGFFLMATNQLIVVYLLWNATHYFTSFFMLLAGLGMILLASFQYNERRSLKVNIHDAGAAMQFIFFLITVILLGFASGYYWINLSSGLLLLIALLPIGRFYIKIASGSKVVKNHGLYQRILVTMMNLWLFFAPLVVWT